MNTAKKNKEEKIGDALLKVALGCRIEEVTEEYAEVDGAMKLTRRRKTKKDIPPDLKAVQMLLSEPGTTDYAALSDGELEAEKARLLALLAKEEKAPAAVKGKTKSGAETGGAEPPKRRPAKRRRIVKKKD